MRWRMRGRLSESLVWLVLMFCFPASIRADGWLYGTDGYYMNMNASSNLLRINPLNASFRVVGTTNPLFGLDYNTDDGYLYGANNMYSMVRVNPNTAATQTVGYGGGLHAVAYNRANGYLYGTWYGFSTLYRVSPSQYPNAAPEMVGMISDGTTGFWTEGMAYNIFDGYLYGVSSVPNTSSLLRINPNDGSATVVGQVPLSTGQFVSGLAYNSSNGYLYGTTSPGFSSGSSNLLRINPQTASTTVVGTINHAPQIQGLAYVPPPRTYAILVGSRAPGSDNEGHVFPDHVRGDIDMTNVAGRLNWAYSVQTIEYNWTQANTVAADIQNAVANVAWNANPGDSLIFFYSGHGSGGSAAGVEDFINPVAGGSYGDDALTTLLADSRLSRVKKVVLLDSCRSEGFWKNDSPGDYDMQTLSNIAFIAAAKEDSRAVSDSSNNYTGYFTNAILSGLTPNATFSSLWTLAQNAHPDNVVGYYKDEGYGSVPWDVSAFTSSDFDLNARLDGLVPEPGDANGDGKIDGGDLALWQQNYDPLGLNANTFAMGDWNGDGRIDGGDLALWKQHYNPLGNFGDLSAFTAMGLSMDPIPEPGTFLLLASALAGLAGVARARRARHS